MHNILKEILMTKLAEVARLKLSLPLAHAHLDLSHIRRADKASSRRSLTESLSLPGLSIIAEVKRKSPSKGALSKIGDPTALVDQYVEGGAAAISVLTDQTYFAGSIEDLKMIASALKTKSASILRKDFIIDESQIIEAVLAGADAILLIVAALGAEKTKELLAVAKKRGLDVLVEVHNKAELDIALKAGAEIIGVNNRNLKTFVVDINTSIKLAKHIPSHLIKVAESGIHTIEDAEKVKSAGYDAALVGEALVKSTDPKVLITQMRGSHD